MFTRTDAVRLVGDIDEKIYDKKKIKKPAPSIPSVYNQSGVSPTLDLPEGHNKGANELLNYQKMKEFAQDFIQGR